jgi:hypothetical protein
MNTLTERQRICLEYLSDKMEATAVMVGRVICVKLNDTWLSYQHVGVGALIALEKKGLVMRLPELRAWRLTKEGREWILKQPIEF